MRSGPLATIRDLTGWVADELGLTVELAAGASLDDLDALAGLALRRNPKRAHLLVSRVLGKHLPVDPRRALEAAGELADRVAARLDAPPLVLGFAETATALGQAVAAAIPGAYCALSTRRPPGAAAEAFVFAEEHSHAVAHRVLAPAARLAEPRPVVLVDDELSSGRTAVNTIRALHAEYPHPAYVVAALIDMRPAAAEVAFTDLAHELGVPVHAVSLLRGQVHVPADAPARVAARVAASDPVQRLAPSSPAATVDAGWPAALPLTARYGWSGADESAVSQASDALAERMVGAVAPAGTERVLVLGTEELMYVPMLLAAALADRLPRGQVRYQSTTRSPVAPIDRDGYAIRCALAFAAPDPSPEEPERVSYVYNVRPGVADHIVVVTDGGDTGPLLGALRGCAPVTEVLLRDEVGA